MHCDEKQNSGENLRYAGNCDKLSQKAGDEQPLDLSPAKRKMLVEKINDYPKSLFMYNISYKAIIILIMIKGQVGSLVHCFYTTRQFCTANPLKQLYFNERKLFCTKYALNKVRICLKFIIKFYVLFILIFCAFLMQISNINLHFIWVQTSLSTYFLQK